MPGLTVPAGQFLFAAQFNHHATGMPEAAGDSYRVEARTQANAPAPVGGGFTPAQ
jgi:hypothetical protein